MSEERKSETPPRTPRTPGNYDTPMDIDIESSYSNDKKPDREKERERDRDRDRDRNRFRDSDRDREHNRFRDYDRNQDSDRYRDRNRERGMPPRKDYTKDLRHRDKRPDTRQSFYNSSYPPKETLSENDRMRGYRKERFYPEYPYPPSGYPYPPSFAGYPQRERSYWTMPAPHRDPEIPFLSQSETQKQINTSIIFIATNITGSDSKMIEKFKNAGSLSNFLKLLKEAEKNNCSTEGLNKIIRTLLTLGAQYAVPLFEKLKENHLLSKTLVFSYLGYFFSRPIQDTDFVKSIFRFMYFGDTQRNNEGEEEETASALTLFTEKDITEAYILAIRKILWNVDSMNLEAIEKNLTLLLHMVSQYSSNRASFYKTFWNYCQTQYDGVEKNPNQMKKDSPKNIKHKIFLIARLIHRQAERNNGITWENISFYLKLAVSHSNMSEVKETYERFYKEKPEFNEFSGDPTHHYLESIKKLHLTKIDFDLLKEIFFKALESNIKPRQLDLIGFRYLECCSVYKKYTELKEAYKIIQNKNFSKITSLSFSNLNCYISTCDSSREPLLVESLADTLFEFEKLNPGKISDKNFRQAIIVLLEYKSPVDLKIVWEILLQYQTGQGPKSSNHIREKEELPCALYTNSINLLLKSKDPALLALCDKIFKQGLYLYPIKDFKAKGIDLNFVEKHAMFSGPVHHTPADKKIPGVVENNSSIPEMLIPIPDLSGDELTDSPNKKKPKRTKLSLSEEMKYALEEESSSEESSDDNLFEADTDEENEEDKEFEYIAKPIKNEDKEENKKSLKKTKYYSSQSQTSYSSSSSSSSQSSTTTTTTTKPLDVPDKNRFQDWQNKNSSFSQNPYTRKDLNPTLPPEQIHHQQDSALNKAV